LRDQVALRALVASACQPAARDVERELRIALRQRVHDAPPEIVRIAHAFAVADGTASQRVRVRTYERRLAVSGRGRHEDGARRRRDESLDQ
jgi:hypothetical protein